MSLAKQKINVTLRQIENAEYKLYENNPILRPINLSTVVADPSLLTPEQAKDKCYHLFCHTIWGIDHYKGKDSLNFTRVGQVVSNAMRPNINIVDDTYYLYYEKTPSLLSKACSLLNKKWFSEIFLMTSKDLKHWSTPKKIIAYDKDYHAYNEGVSISNPYLTKFGDKYRLYYSSGLTYIDDCHFSEPTYISYAESLSLDKDFVSINKPIIAPNKKDKYTNLCSGCLKVYEILDGYIGLQNGIYQENGKSYSAIMLLYSKDGIDFRYVKHILMPRMCGENNWMAQYVYACELIEHNNKLSLYFNARDIAHTVKARECIGTMDIVIK